MGMTGSISRGRPAEAHNVRRCYGEKPPEHIDHSRTCDNVVLADRDLREVYESSFGEALTEYNEKQVAKHHPERQIPDYLAKVRGDKKLQPMYEFVVQVGNMDDHPDAETAKAVLTDWVLGFERKFCGKGAPFALKQAVIHMDEATPHLHVEVVPTAKSSRGLAVQNSMNKAVKQAGFTDYKAMLAGWDEILTQCMAEHGIERVAGDRERQMGGVDIETYKRSMAAQRAADEAEERLECLQRDAEAVQSAKEPVAQSVRTIIEGRGDGGRERELAAEKERLGAGIGELEQQVAAARGRIGELERGIPQLRERVRELEGRARYLRVRLEDARVALTDAVAALREVPRGLSEIAKGIARELGIRAAGEQPSPREVAHAAQAAADWGIDLDTEAGELIEMGGMPGDQRTRQGMSKGR